MAFKTAERKNVKIKGALTGPSGGGKTWSALEMATGIGGKIAVGDSEGGKSQLYADTFTFQVDVIKPPYTVEKYRNVIKAAVLGGYTTLILDSISHEWAGDGGILRQVEELSKKAKGNTFTPWSKMTPQQEMFISEIVNANINIICTMRTKTAWVIEANEKGKQAPKKVGMAPVQRDGIEYEFFFVLELEQGGYATKSADKTGVFEDDSFLITEKHGEALSEWANSGKKLSEKELRELKEAPIREENMSIILKAAQTMTKGKTPAEKAMWMSTYLLVNKFQDLEFKTIEELDQIIQSVRDLHVRKEAAQKQLATITTTDIPF